MIHMIRARNAIKYLEGAVEDTERRADETRRHYVERSLLTTYWSDQDDLVDRPRAMGV